MVVAVEVAWTAKVDKRWYLREDAQQSIRDYSIGGSCPQHTESSQESGLRARPLRRPTAPGAPSPAEAAGSSPYRPGRHRNTSRIGPRRIALANGSSR